MAACPQPRLHAHLRSTASIQTNRTRLQSDRAEPRARCNNEEKTLAAIREVVVPDIGDFKDVPVIEVLVKPGDSVKAEDSLVTLESDKATMEVPAPFAGVVKEMKVKVGDKVSQGVAILTLEADGTQPAAPKPAAPPAPAPAARAAPVTAPPVQQPSAAVAATAPAVAPSAALMPVDEAGFAHTHASPGVRRFARELGVDLTKVKGSGPKGRILKDDVQGHVKSSLSRPASTAVGGGLSVLPLPVVDFSKF